MLSIAALGLLSASVALPLIVHAATEPLDPKHFERIVAVAIAEAPDIAENPRVAKVDIADQWDEGESGVFRGWFGPIVVLSDRKTWIEFTCVLNHGTWKCEQFRYQRVLSIDGRGDLWIENDVTYDEAIALLSYLETRIVKAEPSNNQLTKQEHRDIGHIFSCSEMVCVVTRSEHGIPVQFKVARTRKSAGDPEYLILPIDWR